MVTEDLSYIIIKKFSKLYVYIYIIAFTVYIYPRRIYIYITFVLKFRPHSV